MYSFAQRSDTVVSDEPFYACYLSRTGLNHPAKEEVLKTQPSNEQQVIQSLFNSPDKPLLFIKNMAHHIEVLTDHSFLKKCISIFLIRNPIQILVSYTQVIAQPTLRDIGIAYEVDLFNQVRDQNPVVIDSGLLLQNPESVLTQLCTRAGLKFEKAMLHWQPGPKPYDGVWAPHWYTNVHRSTGFEKQSSNERPLPERLMPLAKEAQKYYDELIQYAIKP